MVNRKDYRPTSNRSSSISSRDRKIIKSLEKEKKESTKHDVLSKKEYKKPTTKAYFKGYKDGIEYSESVVGYYQNKKSNALQVKKQQDKGHVATPREKKRSLLIDKQIEESKPNKEKEKKIKKQISERQENYGDKPNLSVDKKDAKVLGNYYMVENKPYFINGSKKTWLGGESFTKSFDSKVEADNYLKDNPKVTGKILTRKEYAHIRAKEIKSDDDRGQF
jgi:hypothetical protein